MAMVVQEGNVGNAVINPGDGGAKGIDDIQVYVASVLMVILVLMVAQVGIMAIFVLLVLKV